MKAIAFALAFACTAILPANASDDDDYFKDIGTLHKTSRITAAASERADINFRVRYIMMEPIDEEADITTLEDADQFEAIFAPAQRKVAMANLLGTTE